MEKERVPYAKPKSSGKIMGGGGPRDMQRKYKSNKVLTAPKFDAEDLKNIIQEQLSHIVSPENIPNADIDKKIKAAVIGVREEEAKRYESGLKSINEQLNAAKTKIELMDKEISLRDGEIIKLKSELETKITELNKANGTIEELKSKTEHSDSDINEMRVTMKSVLEKLSTLKISGVEVDVGTPSIEEHRVFIDPTDDNHNLQPHIDIEESSAVCGSKDLKTDIDKLRGILGNSKFKPTKTK